MKKIITAILTATLTTTSVFSQNLKKIDKTDCLALLMTIEKNKVHAYRINPKNDATEEEKKQAEEQNKWADEEDQNGNATRIAAKRVYQNAGCKKHFENVDALFNAERKIVVEELKTNGKK